ncbi:hypothetical protein [Mycobacteroides abscessus]|nr:hypothetical protein [Mycobacteroides abscessus]MDB2189633.1 hypothetical protein [Mycobacteroides abscessus subsp. abscessus]MDM2469661.1 hypothetical protein [Mycobacteroides abscessus]MDM2474108.1 hypothetical protein [Mycobacteroides abscessus]MDM2477994.1 hypothetical protein [Mycobacteroides abscessus]MDM2488128.1 hypothetical protein [Mycobacteroides abscessus]
MFEDYFRADDADGQEYGRSASLLDGMRDTVAQLPIAAVAGSPIDEVDRAFTGAPVSPATLLRNAMDHALLNLCHVMDIVEQSGRLVSVPAVMGNIRTSLLATSHLCHATSPSDPQLRVQHMGRLYKLEIDSASKFVEQLDEQNANVLAGMRPPRNSVVRQLAAYTNPYPPPPRTSSETKLLEHMKEQVLGPLLIELSIDEAHGNLLIDHMFNTTSGAAHGYGWIDLNGVVCEFVTHFSCAVWVANIVFNDYLRALGHHPHLNPNLA